MLHQFVLTPSLVPKLPISSSLNCPTSCDSHAANDIRFEVDNGGQSEDKTCYSAHRHHGEF